MSSFGYIAILGRQPELGLVELESRLGAENMEPFGRQAVRIDRRVEVDHFGGIVKLGEVWYDGPAVDIRPAPIDAERLPLGEGKTPFAISVYGIRATRRFVETAGLALKKVLRARGASVRLVVPAEGTAVTAAQLRHNQVLERGFELLVVVSGQRMVIARTLGVQDIDWYSRRDYERPARSAKVGMLPPKLAQVLVNAAAGTLVADPFCGTGVVLQEALLLGRPAIGSDLAPEMVAATQTNLEWLARETHMELPAWDVSRVDARQVRLPAGAAIVSEGYLGPHLTHSPAPAELARMKRELLDLYREALRSWADQLPVGAEVSLCVPAWRVGKHWEYLGVIDELPHLGYTLKGFKHASAPLLYAREGQTVGRQLLFLRKT